MFFGVGVSCRNLYSFVVYLYVSSSGSITSVGEERANLLFTYNYFRLLKEQNNYMEGSGSTTIK